MAGVAQATQTFADPATTETVTGLTNGTSYTFKVAAIDSFTTGPQSAMSAAVAVGAPGPPAVPDLVYNGSSVSLSWAPPATDNGSAVTGYSVLTIVPTDVVSNTQSVGASTTNLVVSGLTLGQRYTFAVLATNARGAGGRSPQTLSLVFGAPIAPAPPTPTTSGDRSATLTWHAPRRVPRREQRLRAQGVQRRRSRGNPSAATTPTSKVFAGLTNGTSYTFTVAGKNAQGVGQESAPRLVVGLPSAPTAVSAVTGDGQATVRWTAASGRGSAIAQHTS